MSGGLLRRAVRDVAVLGAAAAAGAVVGRRAEQAWRAAVDPVEAGGFSLPEGKDHIVRTDDGAELAVRVAGPARRSGRSKKTGKPTVVMAHGWACARAAWAPVAHRLVASGYRVVLYDQRGHGASTVGTESPTVSRLGDDQALLLDQLDLHDVVLAGHSMGGFAVMAFAAGHPEVRRERVRGLMLVSTAAHGLGVGRLDPLVTRVVGSGVVDWALARPRLGLFLVRGAVGRHPRYAHLVTTRDLFLDSDKVVRAALFSGFGSMDLREGLAKVELPTVVMTGSRDSVTPPRLGLAVAAAIPDARFELVPGAGHMLVLEDPDRVANAIEGLGDEAGRLRFV